MKLSTRRYAIASIVALAAVANAAEGVGTEPPPNIVLIMSDDMGYSDIGCYGGEIDTPTLNSLAENGLRFTQFYNTARCWANVSNTPFREYKHWCHEGGISTPLVVHWPKGIAKQRCGGLVHQPGHVVDIMATCVDVAGAEHLTQYAEAEIIPLEGVSLRPAFGDESIDRKDAIYFEHHLNCAVRDGDWKLVRKGQPGNPSQVFPWELYDMNTDRTELHDLADKYPDKVAELSAKWETWAQRANVKPWPWQFEAEQ